MSLYLNQFLSSWFDVCCFVFLGMVIHVVLHLFALSKKPKLTKQWKGLMVVHANAETVKFEVYRASVDDIRNICFGDVCGFFEL
ncbi:hypothetical protein Bca101_038359 [Brassica carinata]